MYGRAADGWIGVQCKNTREGVSAKTILAEVEKAEAFEPALSKFYIATTADNDAKIQEIVRKLSSSRQESGKFEVIVLFWDAISADLKRDRSRLRLHYSELTPASSVPAPIGLAHDQALFDKFKDELAFEPSIRLLREHDFNAAFLSSRVMPLHNFVDSWDTPEHEFTDPELQAALSQFYQAALTISSCIALHTGPVGTGDMLSVFSDNLRARGERPPHVIREAKEMNDAASKFAPLYGEFVRLCRSKLAA